MPANRNQNIRLSFDEQVILAENTRLKHYQLKEKLKINAIDPIANKELADLFAIELSNIPMAKQHYELAINADPKYAAAHLGLGQLLLEHYNDANKSRQHIEQALKYDRTNANIHYILAGLLSDHFCDYKSAYNHFLQALKHNPKHVGAHNNFSTLLSKVFKNYNKAKRHLESVLRINPEHTNAIYNLAALFQVHLKDFKKAKELYVRLLEINPDDLEIYNNLAAMTFREYGPTSEFFLYAEKTKGWTPFSEPKKDSLFLDTNQIGCFNSVFGERYGLHANLDIMSDEPLSNSLRWILKEIKSEVEYARKRISNAPIIHVGFMLDKQLRAATGRVDSEYYIGISTGTFIILSYIFNTMLSSKHILVSYGNIEYEVESMKFYNTRLLDTDTLFLNVDPDSKILPNDETRRSLSTILLGFAIKFLVSHECAHILHGHLDYFLDKTGKKILSWEDTVSRLVHSEDRLDSLTLQTLEYDADMSATQQSMERLLGAYEHRQANDIIDIFSPFFSNLGETIYLLCFSLTTLFRLYGSKNTDYNNLLKYDHPPAAVRLRIVRLLIATLFFDPSIQGPAIQKLMIDELNKKLYTILGEVLIDVHEAFDHISKTDAKSEGSQAIQFAFDNREHIYKLAVRWNEIRDELLAFSFTKGLGKSDLSGGLEGFLKPIWF